MALAYVVVPLDFKPLSQQLLIIVRTVLAAPIRVDNQPFRRALGGNSTEQCLHHQVFGHGVPSFSVQ